MTAFLLGRAAWSALVVWLVATAVFVIYFAVPHDAARLVAGSRASAQTLALVRGRLGLDRPLVSQYAGFLGRLVRGDLGQSFLTQERVATIILRDGGVSGSVALGGVVLWLALGVGAGVAGVRRPTSRAARALETAALACYSMPPFLVGQLLLYFLFFRLSRAGLDLFPPGSYVAFTDNPWQWVRFLALPWLSVALVTAATYSRLTRSVLLETLQENHIRAARAKGVSEPRILYRHALRCSLAPVLNQLGVDVGTLVGGVVVIEVVFGLPGLGREAVQALSTQDLPVIMGIAIVSAVFVVAANFAVDVAHVLIDPRVRIR
jgi:peptide/nickel transport system permease protein